MWESCLGEFFVELDDFFIEVAELCGSFAESCLEVFYPLLVEASGVSADT